MSHQCQLNCSHWCEKSPTNRHRWIIDERSTPSAPGHCSYCGADKRFKGGVGKHAITAAEMFAQVDEQTTVLNRGGNATN